MIDEKVGEIIDALEQNDYLDNSIIIFTSDHGDCLTDHGHSQKWTMYDAITRIPLIVWAPKKFQGGRVVNELCQQMDLGPTILELAGIEVPRTLEAISMNESLEGDGWKGRDYVFAEQIKDGILTGCEFMTMVRNQEWKLVHFLDEPHGQLFNLTQDPDEVHNLWDDEGSAVQKQSLLDVLREWRIRSGIETADWSQDWR
jgi:arylsulfatase A-like enzyme